MGKILLVASGKGGVGKSSFCAGVGAALAALGESVLLIDGDEGIRNLDILLGMTDQVLFSFADVARGKVSLSRAVVASERIRGLFLLTAPGAPVGFSVPYGGIESLLREAAASFSWVVIDCPAGFEGTIKLFAPYADMGVVIATPDGPSLRGAERMASLLFLQGIERVRLVVNRVRPKLTRKGIAANIDDAMDFVGLPLLGYVPEDEQVIVSAARGIPVTMTGARGAAKAYFNIAKRLTGRHAPLLRL